MRKPFWFKSHKCWYVKDQAGAFIRLDPNQDRAEEIWQEMLAAGCAKGTRATVLGVAEAFLEEHKELISPGEFSRIENYVFGFVNSMPIRTLISSVTKKALADWLKAPKPGRLKMDGAYGEPILWSQSSKHAAGRTIKRLFRWAHDEGLITRNQLAGFKLEQPEPRIGIIHPDVHSKLVIECMKSEKSRSFAIYLIASHCGARPQQIRNASVECVAQNGTAWVFQDHKTRKKTRKPLVVFLSPCLQTLTRILEARRKSGLLFLNDEGQPWKKDTVSQRMRRLRADLDLGDEVIAYAYRHTFATDALKAGVNLATVAAMLGHSSVAMVSRVYGHLDQHSQHLVDAVAKTAAKRLE